MAEPQARLLQRTFDAFDAIGNAAGPAAVFDTAAATLGDFGFTAFMLTRLPRPPAAIAPHMLMNGWPSGWTDRYMEAGHYAYDPVARHCMAANDAFAWEEIPAPLFQADARASLIAAEAAAFDLNRGVCVPLHSALGAGGLSLAGPALDPAPGLRAMVTLLAFRLCQSLDDAIFGETGGERLTHRERDVLSWIALGKTVEDIAAILSISEHTVGEHLKHVRRKLGTNNNAHSIVRALQTGQLRL